jgi:ATP-dependent exoDNAse (exonuclease V) beta subunit
MLVDEVQDLTPATIKLLLKITEQNVYFAGDTAQTIARGVGFRFCDLKGMLNMTDFDAPKVLQLTVNFRSHNRILTLANSIITAIELFFPLTIDKLHKEKSNLDGLKPIILDSNLLDSLFYVLMGKNNHTSSSKSIEKSEFGCDQVIIVRDQESKKRVASVLQHALCLTVYECKGLEFEDVILYNFFNDAP